jgi:AbrB family looped-hinge helix DNA binding protein
MVIASIRRINREFDFDGISYYHSAMVITIDRAGRLVIPKSIRDELNLVPGSELEIDSVGGEIRLRLPAPKSRLVEKNGFLVFSAGGESNIDIADFISKEREKEALRAWGPRK